MFDTIEAAQAEVLRLQEEVTRLENERDTLSQNNTTMAADLERVRTLNQTYFNKLQAQYSPQEEKEEPAPMSCVEYAKNLNI